jgi:predicted membrane protein
VVSWSLGGPLLSKCQQLPLYMYITIILRLLYLLYTEIPIFLILLHISELSSVYTDKFTWQEYGMFCKFISLLFVNVFSQTCIFFGTYLIVYFYICMTFSIAAALISSRPNTADLISLLQTELCSQVL